MLDKLKPVFLKTEKAKSGPFKHMFNFRRIWQWAVLLTAVTTMLPLIVITSLDYKVTQNSIESEILLRTSRTVSNTKRTLSFFLMERKSALDFIMRDNSFDQLNRSIRLARILNHLRDGFGGFEDLGLINAKGVQTNYVGPYSLEGKNYSGQAWFRKIQDSGVYISEVFLGYRNVPHLVIAIKYDLPDGSFYVLRATLDTERFNEHLSKLEFSGRGDAFIINHEGIIQTPSRYYGKVFEKILIPVPQPSVKTEVREYQDRDGRAIIVGYAYIPDTPFIMMIVKYKNDLMKSWRETRFKLLGFLAVSITVILIVILGFATYLVNNMHLADQRRLMTLHEMEYSNKLASIGRLAAGVAHEINNPLAIINEKAGLIKDIFTYTEKYANDTKITGLIDSVLSSMERCGTITKRMLSFARHMDVKIEQIKLSAVIEDVLGFLGKEAEYRSIDVTVETASDIPDFESDRGKLQQIFLNIINNAFAAMADGGHLAINTRRIKDNAVEVTITDNGYGMSEADLKRIFEPFFSTKTKVGGTGLGLSITYGLVQELGGSIHASSQEGLGTTFIIKLPLTPPQTLRRKKDASIISG
jgi:signal transduction histidine kinase